MMVAQRHPHVGAIYKFNDVCVLIITATDDVVRWKTVGGRPTIRSTPRWFFERHASLVSKIEQEGK